MAKLVLCSNCERHVRDGESACPFCRAPVASRSAPSTAPGPVLTRAALLVAGVAALGATACVEEPDPLDDDNSDAARDAGAVKDAAASDGGKDAEPMAQPAYGVAIDSGGLVQPAYGVPVDAGPPKDAGVNDGGTRDAGRDGGILVQPAYGIAIDAGGLSQPAYGVAIDAEILGQPAYGVAIDGGGLAQPAYGVAIDNK